MILNWGELITLEYGKPVKDKESTDGEVPVYGTNGQIGTSHLPAQCKHPSFILGRKGAYRGVHYSDCPFSVIDTAFFAEPLTDNIDLKWAYYKFLTYDINRMDSGSAIPSTDRYQIYSIEVEVPPMEEQKKVVAILDCIDKKIKANWKINDNLLEQMEALYRSWFVDYRPFGGLKPESWKQSDIYALANIIYGAPFASKQFNTEGVGKPIIRIRDLKEQQFATYTTEVHPKGYLLQPGDIVVGMDGEFRPYIWGNDEAWLNQRVCVFVNKRPSGKAFLYFTIKPLLYAIEQTQVATTVIHIGKKDYDAFKVTLPNDEILDKFDELTEPIIKQIVSNCFENKRLENLRGVLLPKLMSGEIDVSSVRL